MKSCPTCNRQYVDETMKFCLDDGSLLSDQLAATRLGSDADATFYLPVPPTSPSPPAGRTAASPRSTMTSLGFQQASLSPGLQTSTESAAHSSRGLLWIVVALIIGGSGIAIAAIIMFGRKSDEASVPQPPTYVASPTPAINSESSSSTNESKSQTNTMEDLAQENARRLAKATPFPKPTATKVDVNQEQPRELPPVPRTPISGGVLNGKAIRLVTPTYPAAAKAAHASGAVQVQVLVDESGNVISASATSGHPLLRSAAVSAARSSKFTPTKLSGQAVKVTGVIVYNFVEQ